MAQAVSSLRNISCLNMFEQGCHMLQLAEAVAHDGLPLLFPAALELAGSSGDQHRAVHGLLKQVTTASPHCLNLVTCVPYTVTTGK